MENKFVIGKVFVPNSSLEEFKSQNITSPFLRSLPGYVKGETYERFDEQNNLTMVSMTTWLDQESYENAERSLKEFYQSQNFNPVAYRERLKIVAELAVYSKNDR